MSLDVDVASPGVRAPLGRARVADIARAVLKGERVRHALLSVTLVDRRTITRLNKTHLDHRGATDVISFGLRRATDTSPVIGDIYICPDVARANANARGVPVREEMARLVVHGVLHVLGYDHPEDEARETSEMWKRQERILRRVLDATRR